MSWRHHSNARGVMWSSRRRRSRQPAAVHPGGPARLTNVVSRAHGLTVELPRELARSRRHSHQFSLIMLRDDEAGPSDGAALARVIDRLTLRLRLSDLLIRLDGRRLLVACPETDAAGARVLTRDLLHLVAAEGVTLRASSATFPTSALTACELLRTCESDLDLAHELDGTAPRTDDLHALGNDGGRR